MIGRSSDQVIDFEFGAFDTMVTPETTMTQRMMQRMVSRREEKRHAQVLFKIALSWRSKRP
jgi:hypothetical protein